ncbi:t-SNARE affecting a late Golgi compartment protein 1 [Colletotrichum liriopes]|uniref:t-SNARE affecting a late Golgi compartment protein 1 n=1 Tax=Colletotrichum liriopes TaxID=708192 RepID=A0AA37LRP6_9PEZI|nr:t-SNARE affecting a late Golgi compartment protein 1 [Colletotrichum liriopes]
MMSSANEEDPFLQVQHFPERAHLEECDTDGGRNRDVLAQLDSTRPLFTSYLRIRSLSTSATSPELASARSDLESALESLAEDLADLVESVKAVESDPSAFGLSAPEITRRKRLVQDVGGEVEDMREELAKKLGDASSSFAIADGDDRDRGGEDYAAEFEQQQQLEMMREQDTHLDGVFQTVGNLRRQADDMGRELEEQREMLEVVDSVADRVGGRLQTGVQKLQYVMRRNEDRLSSCCIAVLIFVLIVLLVLLLIL